MSALPPIADIRTWPALSSMGQGGGKRRLGTVGGSGNDGVERECPIMMHCGITRISRR